MMKGKVTDLYTYIYIYIIFKLNNLYKQSIISNTQC